MANQFTIAAEKGLEPGDPDYPKASNQFIAGTRTEHPEEVRAKMRASHAARKLEGILDDPLAKTEHVIAAAKIILDKTVSSLSAVDSTIINREDTNDPDALEAKLRMLLSKADPSLISKLLGERATGQLKDVDAA